MTREQDRNRIPALYWMMAVLATSIAMPARANSLQNAVAAYKKGDYAVALRDFRALASKGNAVAESQLGYMYGTGEGVAKNEKLAFKWYRLAAHRGLAAAQYDLAIIYEHGVGGEKSTKKAFRWIQDAARQNFTKAQYNLGLMYERGKGVPASFDKAADWFLQAAKHGDGRAQAALGAMYARGRGVPENHVIAYAFDNLASGATDPQVSHIASRQKNLIASRLSATEFERARTLSVSMASNPSNIGTIVTQYLGGIDRPADKSSSGATPYSE